jgi:predicted GNAT family N-acyltransferase
MSRQASQSNRAEIRFITAEETLPLRHAILRAGRPVETAHFPGDDMRTSRHFGAYRHGKLLAVASLYAVETPERPGESAFQLRGMATSSEAQGSGLGKLLMVAVMEFAREKRARILWCNARVAASGFYRKLGFEIVGDEFVIPGVGPHFRMMLRIPR